MAGVKFEFRLQDRFSSKMARVFKGLDRIKKVTEGGAKMSRIFENALSRSLRIPQAHARSLASVLRLVGTASRGFDVAKQKVLAFNATLQGSVVRTKALLGSLRSGMSHLFSLPSLIAGGATAMAARFGYQSAAFKQSSLTSFEVMLQSASKGKDVFDRALGFADSTPFSDTQVVGGVRQLLSAGFNPNEIFDRVLRNAGDLAAGMNAPLDQVTRAFEALKTGDFGEAFGAGMGFRQLGITKELLEGAGLRFDKQGSYLGSVTQAMDAVNRIIEDRFGGMTERQSKTLAGLWSTFSSRPKRFLMNIQTRGAEKLLSVLNLITDPNTESGKKIQAFINDLFTSVFDNPLGSLADTLDPGKIDGVISRIYKRLRGFADWWRSNVPVIIAQARAFGGGVAQGFRILKQAWDSTAGLREWLGKIANSLFGLNAAQGSASGGGARLAGTLFTMVAAFKVFNIATLGAAPALLRWSLALGGAVGKAQWFKNGLGKVGGFLKKRLVPLLLNLGRVVLSLGRILLIAGGPWAWVARIAILAAVLIYKNWDKIGPWLKKQWERLSKWAGETWGSIIDAGADALQWLRRLPERIGLALRNMWDSVTRATSSAWQWVVDQVFAAWDWLRNVPGNLGRWFANLWDDLKAHSLEVWESVKSKVSETVTWLEGLPGKFRDIGKNMFQSLADGINSALTSVESAITNAGNKTIEWFKDVLGIQSPSKVFRKLGYTIPQGAEMGILRGQPLVAKAMAALTATSLGLAPLQFASAQSIATAEPAPLPVVTPVAAQLQRGGKTIIINRGAFEGAIHVVVNDARDPEGVVEELRLRFPGLVREAFELLALEDGLSG